MEISFIVPTWNSQSYIEKCIRSIMQNCEKEKICYEILVVDNASTDKTKDILVVYDTAISLICLEKNRGTSYSRNLALKQAKGHIICFLDSDAALKEGSIGEICERLMSSDDVGIIAPKIIFPDGTVQRSIRKFPSALHKLLKIKKFLFEKEPTINEYYKKIPETEAVTVASALSACWFFRRELMRRVGFLDESIFYSPEDLDYCLRVWKAGKSVLYYPFFTVEHHYQRMSYRGEGISIMLSHCKGLLYYFIKHKYALRAPRYGAWES